MRSTFMADKCFRKRLPINSIICQQLAIGPLTTNGVWYQRSYLVHSALCHSCERGCAAHHHQSSPGASDGHVEATVVRDKAQGAASQVASDLEGCMYGS